MKQSEKYHTSLDFKVLVSIDKDEDPSGMPVTRTEISEVTFNDIDVMDMPAEEFKKWMLETILNDLGL